jgi:hypothetical protein
MVRAQVSVLRFTSSSESSELIEELKLSGAKQRGNQSVLARV